MKHCPNCNHKLVKGANGYKCVNCPYTNLKNPEKEIQHE